MVEQQLDDHPGVLWIILQKIIRRISEDDGGNLGRDHSHDVRGILCIRILAILVSQDYHSICTLQLILGYCFIRNPSNSSSGSSRTKKHGFNINIFSVLMMKIREEASDCFKCNVSCHHYKCLPPLILIFPPNFLLPFTSGIASGMVVVNMARLTTRKSIWNSLPISVAGSQYMSPLL